ncbi:MAG: twin-arginine translocation signal domain-containing protein [Actinobacteria bacterium]|nr:twin-arginine translocation signal domain-containing protein [Actinomycetota bacterium]
MQVVDRRRFLVAAASGGVALAGPGAWPTPAAAATTEHRGALSPLLTDAGRTAPVEDDFEFIWPGGHLTSGNSFPAALELAAASMAVERFLG